MVPRTNMSRMTLVASRKTMKGLLEGEKAAVRRLTSMVRMIVANCMEIRSAFLVFALLIGFQEADGPVAIIGEAGSTLDGQQTDILS